MKKLLYIAAPFFTPSQLERVKLVEDTIFNTTGLTFYSPRLDGVLQDMSPEERRTNAEKVFKLNVGHMIHAEGFLAILDEPDTGTHWECGFAYYHKRYHSPRYRTLAFKQAMDKPINVMLQKGFDAIAYGMTNLEGMLADFATGKSFENIKTAEVY
jgi:nucleoside 2-deoxyribosyltransferase